MGYNTITSTDFRTIVGAESLTKSKAVYFYTSIGQSILDLFLCLVFCHMVHSTEATKRIMVLHKKAVRKNERANAKKANKRTDKTRLDRLLNDSDISPSERLQLYEMDDVASAASLNLDD